MKDKFIAIAESFNMKELTKPEKINESRVKLENSNNATPLVTREKINSEKDLYAELGVIRDKYTPFLKSYSPEVVEQKDVIRIKSFFVDGKKVDIPEYGGPVGKHQKTYKTSFEIADYTDKAVYICFDGADYEAFVYINSECVGVHEGFFSPFEFEITDYIVSGSNELKVVLKNDCVYFGEGNPKLEGDKLYAATGIGWDDPELGWHHCPSGMGIYNNVRVEIRNKTHISDVFVRPLCDTEEIEAWVEVVNTDYCKKNIKLNFSLYGENFKESVFENSIHTPTTQVEWGAYREYEELLKRGDIGQVVEMPAENGKNIYKVRMPLKNFKLWDLETPFLYALCVDVISDDVCSDSKKSIFGMRKFTQDLDTVPKGKFYLNDREIKLRGANTMGFEQNDVMREDFKQLIDDILLAKLCNMNFFRLTQRPVQKEVYDYCDRLGLMTQTDLPLFGVMRRTKVAEGIRQAEEMERLVRNHPCNIINSYINEPAANSNNEGHRHLVKSELEGFFSTCDYIVKLNNPDRVIKHIDGDYDPPSSLLPDNHCYTMWYNGHGLATGKLMKDYWISTKEGWCFGCGEYGTEGLDFCDTMREHYPSEWIKEPFNPENILFAQTGPMHHFFYDTCDSMEEWVEKSQEYQAFATRIMSESFRRNNKMISNAIHLFIDAWPSGWMKAIMDFKRRPKKAYFACRNAYEPIMISLRSDRFTYYAGEEIKIECYICNDTSKSSSACKLVFELYQGNKLIKLGENIAEIEKCTSRYSSSAVFTVNEVCDREKFVLKAVLVDEDGSVLNYNTFDFEVFSDVVVRENKNVELITNLDAGEYEIAGEKVIVKKVTSGELMFVSRKTGHKAVKGFKEKDFSYWYNKNTDYITSISNKTFMADGFTPILLGANIKEGAGWHKEYVAAEKVYNGKKYIICLADLRTENPVAKRFLKNLFE